MRRTANFVTWDLRPHRMETVGHASTLDAAIRDCRNDTGRTLTVYDAIGRVAAIVRDGRLMTDSETTR